MEIKTTNPVSALSRLTEVLGGTLPARILQSQDQRSTKDLRRILDIGDFRE
jgi:hypothetical protein